MKKIFLYTSAFWVFVACKNEGKNAQNAPDKDVVAANIDTTVNPADDFFDWANGGWIKRNPIPASESSWSIGKALQKDIYEKMRQVSENAAKENAANGTNSQKIGDFWLTGMDSMGIEKTGITPLRSMLDKIQAIGDKNQLRDMIAELQAMQIAAPAVIWVGQDEKNATQYALYLWQGGLGLGERDYYFSKDARNVQIRADYLNYLKKMFVLAGNTEGVAVANANAVMSLETTLAQAHRKMEDLRDPHKNYNKFALADFQKRAKNIDWTAFLNKIGAKCDSIIVAQPEVYDRIDAEIAKSPLNVWKAYLTARLLDATAPYLSDAFVTAHFDFRGKTLEGKKELKPRWKRVLDAQESALGEALGQLFVKAFFPAEAKKRYENMVDAVRDVYAEQIKGLDWMSQPTKEKALKKLATMKKKIGYPDVWKDFSSLKITKNSYIENVLSANDWWFKYNISKLGKPVDKNEWDMTPQTYNAYYSPTNNEIVCPAAIFMIPGFADKDVDDAVAFGYAAASTIGHEITHGFDDQGRQYDENGNLQEWWTPEDAKLFEAKAQKLVEQFNEYNPLDTMHVRGYNTLGENIADLGGVVLGMKAFMKTEQYKKGEKTAGFTPMQRYFMGYALGWLGHQTNERLAKQLMTDVHSPAKYRVNGPFVNIPTFYETFKVTPQNKMWRVPEKRVSIW